MKDIFALAAIVGGILWLALNLALVGAWERGDNFPTYEFLNALRPLPLALFAFALYGIYRIVNVGRVGFLISLAGFALLAAGAALEFWIGGGVRDGDVDTLSLAGWLTYLVGYLVLSIGLIAFGIAFYKTRAWGIFSIVPLIFALLWVVMGALMLKGNQARAVRIE